MSLLNSAECNPTISSVSKAKLVYTVFTFAVICKNSVKNDSLSLRIQLTLSDYKFSLLLKQKYFIRKMYFCRKYSKFSFGRGY